ncbi:MAG: hypothetical protein ACXQTP_01455, partial [Candidatus Methanofastidiosia archaeon]
MDQRKLDERSMLLKKYFHFDSLDRFSKGRKEIIKLFDMEMTVDSRSASRMMSDEMLLQIFNERTRILRNIRGEHRFLLKEDNFYGRYYTVRNGTFFVEDSWKQKRKALIDALYGPTGSVVWDIL